MKKLITATLLGLAATAPAIAEETLVFDFLTSANFPKCEQTSLRYDRGSTQAWSFSQYSGYATMYHYNISSSYYDDYLVSPDLELEAGCEYVVYAKPSVYSTTDEGNCKFDILMGQGSDVAEFATLLQVTDVPYENYSTPAPTHEVTFTVPEDGNYRVAFRGYPTRQYLKTAKVSSRGASVTPMAAQNFTLTPDADGALTVKIEFEMPTTTLTGQPLEDLTYTIYRGVQKIKNGISAAPGEKISLSDTRGEAGVFIYAVEVTCGENTSEKISKSTYLGAETPENPGTVTLKSAGNEMLLSWTAPAVGTHGADLAPDKLSYTVTRVLDGVTTVVAENTAETTFSETVVPTGLQALHYTVKAAYGAQGLTSDEVASNTLKIGSVALPFTESFANAQISDLCENETVAQASSIAYLWKAQANMATRTLTCDPYDNDGGLGLFNSYNIQRNNSARLSTAPLEFKSTDSPMLTFAMFHITSGADVLKIQISCDNGEWTDVPEATFSPRGDPAGEWSLHSVPLKDHIAEGTSSYRVGFLAESAYGQDIVIDAIKVFNLVEKDLEVALNIDQASVKAGKSVTLDVTVSNNGSADVAADDYDVEVISAYTDEFDLGDLQPIPSMGKATYTLTLPFSTLHMLRGSEYGFQARVNMAGDMVAANNATEEKFLTLEYGLGNPATELSATKDDAGNITLSWTSAKDLTYEPVNITESFEDEAFEDGFTGPFNGWTAIDLDGAAGDRWYTAGGTIFNLCKNAGTPGDTKDGKNVIGVTVKSNAQQNDWLISPRINCRPTSSMELRFLFGMKQISSYGNNYYIELLYTTSEDFDILNPQNDFTTQVGKVQSTSASDAKLPQNNKMNEVVFENIPGEATYVALHFTAKGSYNPAMWVDNIRLTEVDENPLLGYHVYDIDGDGRFNDELVDASETSFTIPATSMATYAADRRAAVSAVYPDGEAEPSNLLSLLEVSGVADVTVEMNDAASETFNLNGVKMTDGQLSPGIYIRRNGSSVKKIVIK